jgi:hypothetical protein
LLFFYKFVYIYYLFQQFNAVNRKNRTKISAAPAAVSPKSIPFSSGSFSIL